MNTHSLKNRLRALSVGGAVAATLVIGQSSALAQATSRTPETGVGELVLGAPGVGLVYRSVQELPFAESANIGKYYKFVFSGIEVQADADGVPGSYPYDGYMWDKAKKAANNGHGNNCDKVDSSNPGASKEELNSDPTIDDECKDLDGTTGSTVGDPGSGTVLGWWEMWGKVNTYQTSTLNFSTPELHKLSNVLRLYLSSEVVIREQDISLSWSGSGNSKDPDGHFYILGSAIKEPPVPLGKLTFAQTMYQDGKYPPFNWSVKRE